MYLYDSNGSTFTILKVTVWQKRMFQRWEIHLLTTPCWKHAAPSTNCFLQWTFRVTVKIQAAVQMRPLLIPFTVLSLKLLEKTVLKTAHRV